MRSGCKAEPASPGTALSQGNACGPDCERSMVEQAREPWCKREEPWCCQPWHLSQGSKSSHCARARQGGLAIRHHRARMSVHPASAADRRQAAQRARRDTAHPQGDDLTGRARHRPRRPGCCSSSGEVGWEGAQQVVGTPPGTHGQRKPRNWRSSSMGSSSRSRASSRKGASMCDVKRVLPLNDHRSCSESEILRDPSKSLYNCTNTNYTINLLTTVRRRASVISSSTCLGGKARTGNKAYFVHNLAGTVW